jgi:alpha-beta hydrolase superfamily lysophospholipase
LAKYEAALLPVTASDGYEWQYCRYRPPGDRAAAEIVCLHGIQSHGGWYSESCRRLASAGYGVSFLDRRGCGVNQRGRGDAPSFRQLLDDVAAFLARLPRPRLLVGISWGGKLAVGLQRRHPGLTDGLILIAPGFCPRVRPPFGERVRIAIARFLQPRRLFGIPLNDPTLFTADPARREFIRNDPLALRQATARLLFESARLDIYLRFAAREVTMPVLLLMAEHDRIIDNAGTRRFAERFPTADVTVIEYPGAHHTLEFEPAGPPFVGDFFEWLEKHRPDTLRAESVHGGALQRPPRTPPAGIDPS